MKNIALILIDIQKGFDDIVYWGGNRNNPRAEENAGRILSAWRKAGALVIHVRHDSSNPKSKLAPGQPGNEIKDIVKPMAGEMIIPKNVNSAFIGTNLEKVLRERSIGNVVIVGLTTDHCVSTTARMAANLGFKTSVVSDATATFDRVNESGKKFDAALIHEAALASLHEEFATVLTTDEIIDSIHEPAVTKR